METLQLLVKVLVCLLSLLGKLMGLGLIVNP